jgi:cytochrome b
VTDTPARTPLWDGPTRLVHWAVAALILTAWLTAGKQMTVHRWAGYAVLGLMVFRLWWGVAGGSTARFASFLVGPRATLAYVKKLPGREPGETGGHNPLGAWSVVAMIALIIVQAGLGLFAVDIDGIESGPLSDRVSFDFGRVCAHWHELTFRILQALVLLHLAAIAFYALWKRENLVGAMIVGGRRFHGAVAPLVKAPLWRLAVGIVLGGAAVWLIARGFKLKF